MNTIQILRTGAGALLLLNACLALEPQGPPEAPWFPFPELPMVLFYEDFEADAGLAKDGKLDTSPDKPGTKSYLMGQVKFTNSDKIGGVATLNFSNTRLKVPNGLKPAQVVLHFSVWAEEDGDLQMQASTQREAVQLRNEHVAAKKWTAVSLSLAQIPKILPADTLRSIHIMYVPSTSLNRQKVYLDDVLVLNGPGKVAEVMQFIQMLRKKVKDLERSPAKDGFLFRAQNVETIKRALASGTHRAKSRTVLVVPPRGEDGAALVQALQKGAPDAKLSGFTFLPAEAPDGSPAGGLEDVRALLKYNLEKFQPEYALLMFSYHDIEAPGCSPEVVRVAVERSLGGGCVPVIVVPPLLAGASVPRQKLESFVNGVTALGADSIVVVDASQLLKQAGDVLVKGELGPQGLQAIAVFGLNGIKCLETNLFNRR